MELGGRVLRRIEDADLARALDAAIFMIFSNQWRAVYGGLAHSWCSSRSTPASSRNSTRERTITVGDPLDENISVGPMISPEHLPRCGAIIELARRKGRLMLCGGLDSPR